MVCVKCKRTFNTHERNTKYKKGVGMTIKCPFCKQQYSWSKPLGKEYKKLDNGQIVKDRYADRR